MQKQFKPDNILKFLYYRIISIFKYLMELAIPSQITDYRKIPIIINNFNRLDYLKKLINSLEQRGYNNIYIIDNHSTYPPLLEYYEGCGYKVFRLEKNTGPFALWQTGIFRIFKKDYFVYTDSDLLPVEECPDDFLLFFLKTLKKHKLASKIGFSLKIDDLPDSYVLKQQVIEHEEPHYRHYISKESLYRAPIDTTFALYRPRATWRHACSNIEIYRTAFPYMARHLPWYTDSSNPDAETLYYLETASRSASWLWKSNS
jgi:glycosyltransferase involved in cell wall biosynthesis